MNKFPCRGVHCVAPVACGAFGYCRERNKELTPLERHLVRALTGMFALHEPEGRFQPSHWKGPLGEARRALSNATGTPENEMTALLAQVWQDASLL